MTEFREPAEFVAGDSVRFSICDAEHRPSSGWSCKFKIANACGNFEFSATANEEHDHFDFYLTTSDTEKILPGLYQYQTFVENTTDRYTLGIGRLKVKQGLALLDGRTDTRTHARRVLEAVECVLENRATRDQESLTLNGRSLSKTPLSDLLRLRDVYRSECRREDVAERIEAGMGSGQKVRIRFRDA